MICANPVMPAKPVRSIRSKSFWKSKIVSWSLPWVYALKCSGAGCLPCYAPGRDAIGTDCRAAVNCRDAKPQGASLCQVKAIKSPEITPE